MNKQISHKIASLVFSILVVCFAIAFYVVAWDEPLQNPAGCTSGDPGCDTPINVGPTGQWKTGTLRVAGFTVDGETHLAWESGNVGIGTTNPSKKLEVVGGPIKATGGLIIETRTSDPAGPETGRMWLRTDL